MMRTSRPLRQAWVRSVAHLDRTEATAASLDLPPFFLCPALRRLHVSCQQGSLGSSTLATRSRSTLASVQIRHVHTEALADSPQAPPGAVTAPPEPRLPRQCPGCGAFSQTSIPDQPGFFNVGKRKSLRKGQGTIPDKRARVREEDRIVNSALRELGEGQKQHLDLATQLMLPQDSAASSAAEASPLVGLAPILCDRCHDLIHHSAGVSAHFPTIDAIREIIEESPYKYNHVYHVLDAADFPMSLLPRIRELLDLMPLRTRNRRAKSGRFYGGQKMEMSFIITRSDLFAPRKEQVDRLMPWITDTLREALGRVGRKARLGNIHCISAKRNWWTKELKEDIWKRGGATWMVGKANVGKSYLFQHVFPKGRMTWKAPVHQIDVAVTPRPSGDTMAWNTTTSDQDGISGLTDDALLPPAQPETEYPQMPIVSSLPGTTASPIRIPFGKGRGELIDLPGLFRSSIVDYVEPVHQGSIMMKSRIQPEQQILKQGQSLLLGGLIRLTPQTPGLTILTYNFTPLKEHRTATDKAAEVQAQTSDLKIETIARPGTGEKIKLAGTFKLKYDVTKERAGPITRRDAVNLKVDQLPYRVLATDILIEGCGWVEVVAQVRAKDLYQPTRRPTPTPTPTPKPLDEPFREELLQTLDLSEPELQPQPQPESELHADEQQGPSRIPTQDDDSEPNWPVIDVFSPEGKFIGSRRPLNAWLKCQPKKSSVRGRPRKSMKGAKKNAKKASRSLSL